MTEKLNPEQRRRVAEAVTERRHVVRKDMNCTPIVNVDGGFWMAHHDSGQWRELVGWLAKHPYVVPHQLRDALIRFIAEDNTEALERMVLEVLEAQDG